MIRTRIAPTPSGLLHRGNAYNFLLTSLLTGIGGDLRLRIDDLDAPRVQTEYLQDIFDTLEWLKIRIDMGPWDLKGQRKFFSQQLRIPMYETALKKLVRSGNVFACACSRKEIAAQSIDGQYPGTCRDKNLPLDTPDAAWRLNIPKNTIISFEDELLGKVTVNLYDEMRDFIVRRRDGIPAYHVASVVDDESYSINRIVRGQDLLTSTAAQIYIGQLLGKSALKEATFYHHPLILDEQGEKLSKSVGSASIKSLREQRFPFSKFYDEFLEWAIDLGLRFPSYNWT